MTTVDSASARADLHSLLGGLRNAASMALRAAVEATETSVAGTTLYNDRSGATRRSLKSSMSGLEGFVSSGSMTRFLENGTRPHVIAAKRGGTLAFRMNGVMMFRKSVNHPGTSPRPFMDVARAMGEQAADYAGEYFVDYAIGRLG